MIKAGALAGTVVDLTLYPLDTIKTRLQSTIGFRAAGGLTGIYSGVSSAILGSAPSAALFFVTYETIKRIDHSHMLAASLGEIIACIVRVPTEVMKQRMQAQQYTHLSQAMTHVFKTEGVFGFYRGYGTTLFREIPFTCIQFPLYEHLKLKWAMYQEKSLSWTQAALCGALAGGIAAATTTPLDVLKTRMILSPVMNEGLIG